MPVKTILVCLTTPAATETLLRLAIPLARRHGAHLIGLHTLEALVVYPGIAMHIPEPAFISFNESQAEEAEAVREVFERLAGKEDFVSEFRLLRAESATASERMIECARATDLVIMSQPDKEAERFDQRHAQAQVIRHSGRPVILVPKGYEGPEVGQTILLGWSDTREATRAAHDMLTLARPGAALTVLRVGSEKPDPLHDSDGIDMVEMFARHGLSATLEHRATPDDGIASALQSAAFEKGADLIVTGAFGHSRAYDFVLGATTYALMRTQRLPVLFSK